ncbi:MAG: hypothetical protein LBS71_00580 [Puniceicoccales bacterium]|jgi:hypothetical protein|nr:hypothetical protein [Puniceicoccales bacterium]
MKKYSLLIVLNSLLSCHFVHASERLLEESWFDLEEAAMPDQNQTQERLEMSQKLKAFKRALDICVISLRAWMETSEFESDLTSECEEHVLNFVEWINDLKARLKNNTIIIEEGVFNEFIQAATELLQVLEALEMQVESRELSETIFSNVKGSLQIAIALSFQVVVDIGANILSREVSLDPEVDVQIQSQAPKGQGFSAKLEALSKALVFCKTSLEIWSAAGESSSEVVDKFKEHVNGIIGRIDGLNAGLQSTIIPAIQRIEGIGGSIANYLVKRNWSDMLNAFIDGTSQLLQLLKAHKEELSQLDSKSYAYAKSALIIAMQVALGLQLVDVVADVFCPNCGPSCCLLL